jgi:hypothetical protein
MDAALPSGMKGRAITLRASRTEGIDVPKWSYDTPLEERRA